MSHNPKFIDFPDKVFERFLLDNFDYDEDGRISAEDASRVESMQIDGSLALHITNLQGIEHFANLRELTVQHTNIGNLDISRNENLKHLNCADNRLLRLNLGSQPQMKRLYCDNNRLERLDVSGLPSLKLLHCTHNWLTELHLANKRQLIVLLCGNNLLPELDVSDLPLMFLRCENNLLTKINLSQNKHLIDVQFNGNPLERLSLPAFYESRIEEIICNNKHLGTIKKHYTPLWDKVEVSPGNDAAIKIDFIKAIKTENYEREN